MTGKENPEMKYVTVAELIATQKRDGSVDVSLLPIDSVIQVYTRNSLYVLQLLDPESCYIKIQGGKNWKEPIHAYLNGSTWNGSMLYIKQLGIGMRMELAIPDLAYYTTTSVNKIIVYNRDKTIEGENDEQIKF